VTDGATRSMSDKRIDGPDDALATTDAKAVVSPMAVSGRTSRGHRRYHACTFLVVGFLLASFGMPPNQAGAVNGDCIQPSTRGVSPTASDCLFVLRAAVGLVTCEPACICAPRGNLPITAGDALVCLKSVVGQSVSLSCPCPPVVARIEIEPGAILLTVAEQTASLDARAFDKNDQPMDVEFAWESTDPDSVSVQQDGSITSHVSPGSAQIIAKAGGRSSPPLLVVVATPVPGASLVFDEDILEMPKPENEDGEYAIGSRYTIVLDNAETPEVGTILLAAESAPVGGRVVGVEARQDGSLLVTLEVVPIAEMFDELLVDEVVGLSSAALEFPAKVLADYEIAQASDGVIFFEPRDGVSSSGAASPGARHVGPGPSGMNASLDGAQGTSALGPFSCQFTTTFPLVSLVAPSFAVTPDLDFVFAYDSGAGDFERLELKGSVKVELKNESQLTAAFEGKVECSVELVALTIPIGGPLAFVIGGHVPLGVGFELGGKTTVASVGFEAAVEASAAFNLGLACPGTQPCEFLHSLNGQADGKIQVRNLPDFADDLSDFLDNARVEPGVLVFGFAKLALGNRFFESLRFEALDVKTGLSAAANLASIPTQLLDENYASDAKLSLEAVAGAGKSFNSLLGLLQVTVVKLESKLSIPLSRSPSALQARADVADFDVGDTVLFTVTLDPETVDFLPIGYNVEQVRIYRLVDLPDLTRRPVMIASKTASTDQVAFQLQWIASEDGEIDSDFFAMVTTILPAAVPLELAPVVAAPPTTTTTTSSTTTTTLPTGNVVASYRYSRVFALALADATPEFRNSTVDQTEHTSFVFSPMTAQAEQSDEGTISSEMVTATATATASTSPELTSNATEGIVRLQDSGTAAGESFLSHSFGSTAAGSHALAILVIDFTVKQATPFHLVAEIEQSVAVLGNCRKEVKLTRFSPFGDVAIVNSADLADPSGTGTAEIDVTGTLTTSTYRLTAEVSCTPLRGGSGLIDVSASYDVDLRIGSAVIP
jgi:hypothetical protein